MWTEDTVSYVMWTDISYPRSQNVSLHTPSEQKPESRQYSDAAPTPATVGLAEQLSYRQTT